MINLCFLIQEKDLGIYLNIQLELDHVIFYKPPNLQRHIICVKYFYNVFMYMCRL